MSEELKPQFIDEDISIAEPIHNKKKISDRTRKFITWSALLIVIIKAIDMFVGPFLQSNIALTIGFRITGDLLLISLAVGFYLFYQEEKHNYLLISAILVFIGGIINIPSYIIIGLAESDIITTSNSETLTMNILSIVSIIALFAAFVLMKLVLDGFRKEQRNIFKGQLSLPIGYILQLIYVVMFMIVPLDTIMYINAEGQLDVLPEYATFYNIAYYISIAYAVMIVWGFWYLRRAYTILDKLPEDYFQKLEERRQAMMQQRVQRTQQQTQSMLGLGRPRPIPPSERNDDEIEYKPTIIPPENFKGKKMFCVKCGLELEHDAIFCANCGEPNPYIKR